MTSDFEVPTFLAERWKNSTGHDPILYAKRSKDLERLSNLMFLVGSVLAVVALVIWIRSIHMAPAADYQFLLLGVGVGIMVTLASFGVHLMASDCKAEYQRFNTEVRLLALSLQIDVEFLTDSQTVATLADKRLRSMTRLITEVEKIPDFDSVLSIETHRKTLKSCFEALQKWGALPNGARVGDYFPKD